MKATYTVSEYIETGVMRNEIHPVEIIGLDYCNERYISKPILHAIRIKFLDDYKIDGRKRVWVKPDKIQLDVHQKYVNDLVIE